MKTNRSVSRLNAVQALYQNALTQETFDRILKDFLAGNVGKELIEENPYTDAESFVPVMAAEPSLFSGIISAYVQRRNDVDEMITACLKNDFSKSSSGVLFWSVLSAGVTELLSFPETPVAVIINEYVDIAQSFYGSNAPEVGVANGILRQIAENVREAD